MKYGKYTKYLEDHLVASIDNVVVDYKLDSCQPFLNWIASHPLWVYEYSEHNGGIGKFKYRFTFQYGPDSSATVMVGLFSASGIIDKVRLDYNPNKVTKDNLDEILVYLLSHCKAATIVRWDLAIDIPCKRREAVLVRTDRRNRGYEEKSEDDYTEYLGRRNTPGRYKLYNKTIESALDYDVTRSELTCSGEWSADDVLNHLPLLYIFEPFSDDAIHTFGHKPVSILAGMIIRHPEEAVYMDFLDWKTKKNLRNILEQCSEGSSSVHSHVSADVVTALYDALCKDIIT